MGLDYSKYPYLVQLRPKPMFNSDRGAGMVSSIDIDLDSCEIAVRKIKRQDYVNTRIYDINEDSLQELLSFFTIDAIDSFNSIPEDELIDEWTGYRDEGYRVEYCIFFKDHDPLRIEGSLTWSYEHNPMERLLVWLRETALPDLVDVVI